MVTEIQQRIDAVRQRSSEVENHLIDTFLARRIDRRDFVRRGTVLGMSMGTLGFVLCTPSAPSTYC